MLLLWEYPWFAIKWPSLCARFTISGYKSTFLPITKKDALTSVSFNISKTLGVIETFGPSSKVRNAIFSEPEVKLLILSWKSGDIILFLDNSIAEDIFLYDFHNTSYV